MIKANVGYVENTENGGRKRVREPAHSLKGDTNLVLLNTVRCGKTTGMLLKGKNITK